MKMLSMSSSTRQITQMTTKVIRHQRFGVTTHMSRLSSTKPASCPMNKATSSHAVTPKPFSEMPGPKGVYNLPYIGFLFHLKPFSKYSPTTIHLLMDELVGKYGGVFLLQTNKPTVIITDPKDLSTVVHHEGKYPLISSYEIFEHYQKRTGTPRDVGTSQGQEWWKLRQPMQKILLRPKELSCYIPSMNEVADEFIQMLSDGYLENHDTNEAFVSFMAESVGTALFNKRLGFLHAVQTDTMKKVKQSTLDMFDILQKTQIGISNSFRIYKSKDYRTFESALRFLRNETGKYIKEEKEIMAQNKSSGVISENTKSVLSSLLKQTTEDGANSIMDTVYPAAIDSSASGLQLILHALATHPSHQEKLREEVCRVLDEDPKRDRAKNVVTQEHLDKMTYLKAFIKEAFRLRAVAVFQTSRILPEDVVLGGYHVPAGVPVLYSSSIASRDESVFKNPHRFDPERWIRANTKTKSDDDKDIGWAVQTFGIGPRSCPGRRLFEQEACLFLTKLLYKYAVGLEPESQNVDFEYRIFIRFVKPLKFTFTSINGNIE